MLIPHNAEILLGNEISADWGRVR